MDKIPDSALEKVTGGDAPAQTNDAGTSWLGRVWKAFQLKPATPSRSPR